MVRAGTTASPFDGGQSIAVLEIDLGLPWDSTTGDKPIVVGNVPNLSPLNPAPATGSGRGAALGRSPLTIDL